MSIQFSSILCSMPKGNCGVDYEQNIVFNAIYATGTAHEQRMNTGLSGIFLIALTDDSSDHGNRHSHC